LFELRDLAPQPRDGRVALGDLALHLDRHALVLRLEVSGRARSCCFAISRPNPYPCAWTSR